MKRVYLVLIVLCSAGYMAGMQQDRRFQKKESTLIDEWFHGMQAWLEEHSKKNNLNQELQTIVQQKVGHVPDETQVVRVRILAQDSALHELGKTERDNTISEAHTGLKQALKEIYFQDPSGEDMQRVLEVGKKMMIQEGQLNQGKEVLKRLELEMKNKSVSE